jgi:hypothetical protein
MTAAKVATYATIGAVAVWAVKALVIGLAGGLEKSPSEAPLFILGMAMFTVGVVSIGLAITAGRSPLMRVLGVVGTVAATMVVWLAIDTVIASMAPENDPSWVWAEVQLWLISVAFAVGWQFWIGRIGRRVPAQGVPA